MFRKMWPKINILRSEVKHLSSQGLQLRKVRNMLNDQMGFFKTKILSSTHLAIE